MYTAGQGVSLTITGPRPSSTFYWRLSIPFRRTSMGNLLTALSLTGMYSFNGVVFEDVLFGNIVSDCVGFDGVVLPIFLVPLLLLLLLLLFLLILLFLLLLLILIQIFKLGF